MHRVHVYLRRPELFVAPADDLADVSLQSDHVRASQWHPFNRRHEPDGQLLCGWCPRWDYRAVVRAHPGEDHDLLAPQAGSTARPRRHPVVLGAHQCASGPQELTQPFRVHAVVKRPPVTDGTGCGIVPFIATLRVPLPHAWSAVVPAPHRARSPPCGAEVVGGIREEDEHDLSHLARRRSAPSVTAVAPPNPLRGLPAFPRGRRRARSSASSRRASTRRSARTCPATRSPCSPSASGPQPRRHSAILWPSSRAGRRSRADSPLAPSMPRPSGSGRPPPRSTVAPTPSRSPPPTR